MSVNVTSIKNSFIQFLNQEKKQRNVRDELLVKNGLTPSLTYQMEHQSDKHFVHDEEDHGQMVDEMKELAVKNEVNEEEATPA